MRQLQALAPALAAQDIGPAAAATEAALAWVVSVFGASHPNHAYLFAKLRADRMKVLVHDWIDVWLVSDLLTAYREGRQAWREDWHERATRFGQIQLGRASALTPYHDSRRGP